jgi:hypothetical protein
LSCCFNKQFVVTALAAIHSIHLSEWGGLLSFTTTA